MNLESDSPAEAVLDLAIERFGRFHSQPALTPLDDGRALRVDTRLVLYYANRLVDYELQIQETS